VTPLALLWRASASATGSEIDRSPHFTEQGVMLGSALLVATFFMLWVLWSFWREGRSERSGSPRKITSRWMEPPLPSPGPAQHPLGSQAATRRPPSPPPAAPSREQGRR
jgi:hypothetical protein